MRAQTGHPSGELLCRPQPTGRSIGDSEARIEMTNTFDTQSRPLKAAVVRRKGGPFQIETLLVEEPRADEVLVRIVATGMCHTDIVIRDQVYPLAKPSEELFKVTAYRSCLFRSSSNCIAKAGFHSTG